MHQVVVSTDVDDTPFCGGKDGGGFGPPFYISAGFIWRSAYAIGDADLSRRKKERYVAQRAAYRSLMEGRKS
jgi:hypothetical protein